jgi:Nucleoid-associated protein
VDDFTSSLQQSFQHKSNRSYAYFADNSVEQEEGFSFPELLVDLKAGEKTFNEFSVSAARLLASAVNKYGLVCQGYLYFIKYKYLASEYILIGVLEPQESIAFSDVMRIETVRYVDLDKLGLVARIDLSDYESTPELKRYISFIKGRAGRKVADFFLEFLGASESTSQKVQNDVLVNAVSSFVVENGLSRQEAKDVKQELAEYCKSQIKSGEELDTRSIAGCMPQEQSEGFYHFLTSEVGLPESFPPNQSSLRALTKYIGSGGGLTISFDEKLLGERISYDKTTDTLTITGLPPNLKDQLLRNNS